MSSSRRPRLQSRCERSLERCCIRTDVIAAAAVITLERGRIERRRRRLLVVDHTTSIAVVVVTTRHLRRRRRHRSREAQARRPASSRKGTTTPPPEVPRRSCSAAGRLHRPHLPLPTPSHRPYVQGSHRTSPKGGPIWNTSPTRHRRHPPGRRVAVFPLKKGHGDGKAGRRQDVGSSAEGGRVGKGEEGGRIVAIVVVVVLDGTEGERGGTFNGDNVTRAS